MCSVSTFKKENISNEVMCCILLLFLNIILLKLKNIHKEKMTFLRHKIQISISYNNLNKNAYFFKKKIILKNAHNALRFPEAIYS